ncbi:growth hormone secretagogue receptor type 1-like [Ylistrum balloti]|uniref:growth hormone secretagogue receptor type 1-like n=1 Tax=Ylistrum balloti TaxID=509963 RepID=UPI0029058988|nr:growth hormone secretagogue receptor type 1-like [Ylistrum balloti]
MSTWTMFDPPDYVFTSPTYPGSSSHNETYINTTDFNFITGHVNNSNVSTADVTSTSPTEELLAEVSSYLWKILSPVLFLVGIFGNTFSVIILRRMRFLKKPSLFFLVPLAFTDMTVLCVGLSRYWVNEMFDFDLRLISQAGCKINLFVIYVSMQFSSWILVCFTFERFLKTNFPFRYIRVMTVKKEILALIIIFSFLVCVDGHLFWTNGLTTRDGSLACSSLTDETFHFDEYVFVYIDFVFLSILPAILMFVMNICIVRVYRRSIEYLKTSSISTNAASNRHRYSIKLTKMALVTNSYFLFATLPICLYFIVDSYTHTDDAVFNAKKDLAWSVVYILQFSNYTMNFFLYVAANDKFRLHFFSILKCQLPIRFSRKRSSAYSAQSTSTFRITSEDSETMAGGCEREGNNNQVSPSSHLNSVTTSRTVSVHSLSAKKDKPSPTSLSVRIDNPTSPSATIDKPSLSSVSATIDKPSLSSVSATIDKPSLPSVSATIDKPSLSSVSATIDKPSLSSVSATIDKPSLPSVSATIDKPSLSSVSSTIDKPSVRRRDKSKQMSCVPWSKRVKHFNSAVPNFSVLDASV